MQQAQTAHTYNFSIQRLGKNFFPPSCHEYFCQFFNFSHSFRQLQFHSDSDHWKIPKYLCICMSTSFACIFNDAFIQFILIIYTRNNNFSMTTSDNFLAWICVKIWSPQKLFWCCMGRCSSKYACHIQILDENKAAYNVLHFLLVLLLVNDFWYVMQ